MHAHVSRGECCHYRTVQADSSEAGKYYAKVMQKIVVAPDFVSKEVARLTKMKARARRIYLCVEISHMH